MTSLTTSAISVSEVETYLDANATFACKYFTGKFSRGFSDAVVESNGVMSSSGWSAVNSRSKQSQVLKPLRASVSLMNPVKVRGIFEPETAFESARRQSEDSATNMSRADLVRGLDERELLMELIREISNELDVQRLSHKILVNIGILTNADRCSLFLVEGSKEKRILVSKLFDVTSEASLESTLRKNNDHVYTVPFGVGIAGYSAQTGEIVNIKNAYEVSEYSGNIDNEATSFGNEKQVLPNSFCANARINSLCEHHYST